MNLSIKSFIFLFFLLISNILTFGVNSPTINFSMHNGLPSNSVNDIFEDSRGLVWLATDAGVCEFTGATVKFRPSLSKLVGEQIKCIKEDLNGNLLFAVKGVGLYIYDGNKLRIIQEKFTDYLEDIHSFIIYKDKLFFGTSNGVFYANTFNGIVKPLCLKDSINVLKIILDKNRLIIYSKEKFISCIYDIESDKIITSQKTIQVDFGKQLNKRVAIGSLSRVLLKENNIERSYDIIQKLKIDEKEYFLLRNFVKGKEFRKIISYSNNKAIDISTKYKLKNIFIKSLFQKKNGGSLWLGTRDNGLLCIKKNRFSSFDMKDLKLANQTIVGIEYLPSEKLVIATEHNILKLVNNKITELVPEKNFCYLHNNTNCQVQLKINDIRINSDGILWIATNKGFYTLNIESNRLNYKGGASVNNFTFTQDGKLFCSAQNGFCIYNPKQKGKKNIKTNLKYKQSDITKILEHNGEMWISIRSKGIVRYKKGKVFYYNNQNTGIHNIVNDFSMLSDSLMIVAGNNGIIYKLKLKNDSLVVFDTISEPEGLRGMSVLGFQYLSDGSLWCGTNEGIHRFVCNSENKKEEKDLRFWSLNDANIKYPGKESLVDKDGNIWVNTSRELIKINTKCDKSEQSCDVTLLKVLSNGYPIDYSKTDKWTGAYKEPIFLSYNEKDITFKMAYSYCESPYNNLFRYRLLGQKQEWSEWRNSNEAVYTNLLGGEYRFEFEGKCLSTGCIARFGVDLVIDIPWYRTAGFILLVLILFIIVVVGILNIYKNKIRKEEKNRSKQINKIVGLKIKAIQYQLDPHFIFNSLNSIQSYMLDDDVDLALEYLSDFSMILRKNISNADKNFIHLNDELSYLRLYLKMEQMRFADKFDYEIKMDSNIKPMNVKVPPMIIQPFLEYTIRKGLSGLEGGGKLILRFKQEKNGYLKCIIIDNGIPYRSFDKNTAVTSESDFGNSLQLTRERLELLNKVSLSGKHYYYSIEKIPTNSLKESGVKTELGFPVV
ncbi:histidine kinase [Marinifilum sp. RC60d5]|uniref:histidine kinase n=1 Tax=Marinifilum sp. RC60d5 TaxID=3458414 RepID=UPI004035EF30